MNDAKEQMIRAVAERLARGKLLVKAMRERNEALTSADEIVEWEKDYRVALADLIEAEADITRVTRAEFQPE